MSGVNEDQVLAEAAHPTPAELGAMSLDEWRDYLMAEWSRRAAAGLPDSPDHAPD